MVITQLWGGLGNQLFQYATGLATALRRNTTHKLDLRYLGWGRVEPGAGLEAGAGQTKPHRTFVLDRWNVNARVASRAEMKAFRIFDRIIGAAKPGIPYFARPVVKEQSLVFDPAILQAPKNCMLLGCWQSEKYFLDIESTLRLEFTPRHPLSSHAAAMADMIGNTDRSVFLHVRRGDYLASDTFEACPLGYYRNAISYIEQRIDHPRFFVFSDDPEWAFSHLATSDRFTLVTRPELPNYRSTGYEHEDLWLMGLCRHGIISNSTFSWWGAWLNNAKERIVVAPTQWLSKPAHDSRVIIPERWVTISA